jgi:hypothetical protein
MKKAIAPGDGFFSYLYDGQSLASLKFSLRPVVELWDLGRSGLGRISLDSYSRWPELVSHGSSR